MWTHVSSIETSATPAQVWALFSDVAGRTRVSYSTEIGGPQEAEPGPVVVGDFPEVLSALKRHLEIPAAEERLRLAMLASDVQELDQILADDLLFTNHMGQIVSKPHDLELHRSGTLRFRSVETVELQVLGNAALPMTSICVKLDGSYGGQDFETLLRFTRIWRLADNGQWQLVVVHSGAVV